MSNNSRKQDPQRDEAEIAVEDACAGFVFEIEIGETKESTAGVDLPPDSFGHTGFTGTSLWIDPEHQRVFILLTNRTHARQIPFANINSVRRRFHSLAVIALEPQRGTRDTKRD